MNTILKTIVIGLSLVISTQANAQSEKFKIQNPYYSRTATNLLNVSNTEWKRFLALNCIK